MSDHVLQPEENRISQYRIFSRERKAAAFIVVLIIIFAVLSILVHGTGTLPVDIHVTEFVQQFRTPALDRFFRFITLFGSFKVMLGFCVVGIVLLGYFRKYKSMVVAAVSLLSSPLNAMLKTGIDRLRPTSTLVQIISPAGGFSFPSGHAMISMTVYGVLTYLTWVYLRSTYRPLFVSLAAILIFLIGLSRIYLGVHWFTDVMGGWTMGLLLVAVLIQIHTRITEESKFLKTGAVL